jgi:hypothetical protein
VVTERRKRFVQWLNFIVTRWQQDYSHVAWAADDIRYRTEGWDDIIRQHNELVVYGEDGIHNKMMATHPFVRSVIPNTLGFLAPQSLDHICADLFIQNLGIEIGSIAYDDRLKTEHLHHSVGKSKNDQTYEEAAAFVDRDSATFIHEITPVIPELARKVRAKCS